MRIASIASGSSGNCTYIGTQRTHLLIDVGIPCKRIVGGLAALDVDAKDLDAVLITHEHTDHIQGLRVFCRKTEAPVYATEGTINAIWRADVRGQLDHSRFRVIHPDEPFPVGDFELLPFAISHDAAEPVAYRAQAGDRSAAVVTDLGMFNEYTLSHLQDLDALIAEANHDIRMLEAGPYPFPLKRRILGDRGHLSNMAAGRMVSSLLNDRMKHVFLGHLSRENNYPELAREAVRCEIEAAQCRYHSDDFPITVAPRDTLSEVIEF